MFEIMSWKLSVVLIKKINQRQHYGEIIVTQGTVNVLDEHVNPI